MREKCGKIEKNALQTYVEAGLQNLILDEDFNLRDVSEEAIYNSLLGAVSAAVFNAPNTAREYMTQAENATGTATYSIYENERMSSSATYAVKKDLTSSGEFVRRFNVMTDDSQLRRDFYSESKNMLHRRSGTNGEDLIFYNPRLKKWYRSTKGTEAGQPEYNAEIKLGLKENKSNELIAFHNHPLGMPPSVENLNVALQNGYAKGYTIGHNGRMFEYTAPKEYIPASSYDFSVASYLKMGYSEYEAQFAALQYLSELYGFTFREVK